MDTKEVTRGKMMRKRDILFWGSFLAVGFTITAVGVAKDWTISKVRRDMQP